MMMMVHMVMVMAMMTMNKRMSTTIATLNIQS